MTETTIMVLAHPQALGAVQKKLQLVDESVAFGYVPNTMDIQGMAKVFMESDLSPKIIFVDESFFHDEKNDEGWNTFKNIANLAEERAIERGTGKLYYVNMHTTAGRVPYDFQFPTNDFETFLKNYHLHGHVPVSN